jgi:hypothetical protein
MNDYDEVFDQFDMLMNFIVGSNSIWGMNQEHATMLFDELGFPVKDWSWYDGHMVQLECTKKTFHMVTYVACAHIYSFNTDLFSINVIEVPHLASQETKNQYDFSKVELKALTLVDYSPTLSSEVNELVSDEFKMLIHKLNIWQNSFDRDPDCQYNVQIYFADKGKINEL